MHVDLRGVADKRLEIACISHVFCPNRMSSVSEIGMHVDLSALEQAETIDIARAAPSFT